MFFFRAAFATTFLTLVFSVHVFAKSRTARIDRFSLPQSPAIIVVDSDRESAPSNQKIDSMFRIGPEISVLEGLDTTFGYGFMIGYSFRAGKNSPVFLGMDIGLTHWAANYEKTEGEGDAKQKIKGVGHVNSVPILFTMYYRFLERGQSRAIPYLGVSMGPSLVTIEDPAIKFGTNPASGKGAGVKFQVLVRPGVDIEMTDELSLTVEPKVGIFQGLLLFSPQLGVSWSL